MNTNLQCPVCRYFPPSPDSRAVKSMDVLIFVDWFTQRMFEFYVDLNDRLKDCGHPVKIVDLSAFTFPQQSRSFIRAIDLDKAKGVSGAERLSPKYSRRLSNPEISIQLEDSVRSHLATKFNGRTNRVSEAIDTHVLRMMSSSLYSQLQKFESSERIWVFTNGRLPHQRALIAYCKLHSVKHLVIESDQYGKSHYWARPYPTHDRESLQREADPKTVKVDTALINRANKWFIEHALPQSKINKFTQRFQVSRENPALTEKNQDVKNAVMFTSSSDEFIGLGDYWPSTGWNGQYESFSHLAKILEDLGWSITLRIHPNLQNKSLRTIREDYSQLRRLAQEFQITIVGPQSSVNSYELLDSADVVVVSSSTIGLEALHRDKKVIVTENSKYDLFPGVLKVGPETDKRSVIEFLEATFVPGGHSASEWVAVQMSLGWSAQERPGLIRKNSFFGKLKYLLNWTFLLDTVTLVVPRLAEALPRRALLRKIRKLEEVRISPEARNSD